MTNPQIVPVTAVAPLCVPEPVNTQPISDKTARPMSCQTAALTRVRRFVSKLVRSLARHFDGLVRAADGDPRDVPKWFDELARG